MMLRLFLMFGLLLSIACQSPKKAVTLGPVVVVEDTSLPSKIETSAEILKANRRIPDALLHQIEQGLTNRFRHQILWNDGQPWFRLPQDGKARVTVYQTSGAVWFCSRALGTCERLQLWNNQLGGGTDSRKCEDGDEESYVLKFVEETATTGHDMSQVGRNYAGGAFGSITLTLDSREEIVKRYKQLRPAKLQSLQNWIQKEANEYQQNGYHSITIASFDDSDPYVHLYGDRKIANGGPLVFTVFWIDEIKEWKYAAMLTQQQNPNVFAQQKAIIQEIACDIINFK